MIIASAQTSPKRENISANIEDHLKLTKLAVKNGADLILFPEMSLTSYERKKAHKLTFSENDSRLIELRKISKKENITIIAGAPISIQENTYIGCFVISPNNGINIYTKQHLHGEENDYFVSSCDYNPLIEIKNERISVAICADINQEQHIINAKNKNSTIYLAGIFFDNTEMVKAHKLLSGYAEKHQINLLMSNFAGDIWDMTGGGKSALWNNQGKLVGELNETESGILLFKKEDDNWKNIPVKL